MVLCSHCYRLPFCVTFVSQTQKKIDSIEVSVNLYEFDAK